jgi:hypothetical protein
MPGRKTVVLLSEGFEVPDNVRKKFNEVEDRANRHNVTFYTMDAAGLRVHSRMPLIAAAVGQAGEQNFASGIASDPTGERTEMMWRDPTAGLEPRGRHTGVSTSATPTTSRRASRRSPPTAASCSRVVVEPGARRHVQDRRG